MEAISPNGQLGFDRPFRWEDIDHTLVGLKTTDLAIEMHAKSGAEERRIRFENRLNLNSNTIPSQVLAMKEKNADEWARRLYEIYCDVWKIQGHQKSAAFVRFLYSHAIRQLLGARASSIKHNLSLWARRRLHILPALANLRISDVAPLHIERLLQSRLEGGSSPKTVRNLVGLLQSIFSLAVDNDLIPRLPVRDRHKPRVTRAEKPVWSPEQLKQIVDSVPQVHRSLFQCAMLPGAQLGELLGLQWKHIDLDAQTLEIRQSLWEGELVAPKTEGSVRLIYFGPSLLAALMGRSRTRITTVRTTSSTTKKMVRHSIPTCSGAMCCIRRWIAWGSLVCAERLGFIPSATPPLPSSTKKQGT
jgi:integrase